jgi:quercetin dioxygenase-like cupin family protein
MLPAKAAAVFAGRERGRARSAACTPAPLLAAACVTLLEGGTNMTAQLARIRQPARWLAAAVAVSLLATAGGAAPASPPAAAVATLMQRDLPDLNGREALLLSVEYPPGGASLPHRHDADVFVYVLAGEVVMQVLGQPAVTLKTGDTFYEGPADVHVRSANASSRAPARLLVFMVKDKNRPVSRAVDAPGLAEPR